MKKKEPSSLPAIPELKPDESAPLFSQPYLDALEKSILRDMKEKGVPYRDPLVRLFPTDSEIAQRGALRKKYNLNPDKQEPGDTSTPLATLKSWALLSKEGSTYDGTMLSGIAPQDSQKFLNERCAPVGKSVADSSLYRVQAGLHEASHSIDHAQTENSIKTRNGIGSYALLDAAVKEFKGKTTDDYPDINDPVNRQLSGNLSEGLADGSAVRFMLQRYGNKPEVVKFAQDFANFRQANPNRTGYVTHSVIRQVLEDWQARGQPNDPSYTLTQAVADTHGVMKNNLRDLVHTIAAGQFNNDPKNPAKDQEAFRPLLKEPSTPAATLRQTHVAHSADAKNKLCGPKVAAP